MPLPTYNKSKRRRTFEQLPKNAYVIRILSAKLEKSKDKKSEFISFAFDIDEGDYAGFYKKQYEANTNEDKKWPNDAVYRLSVPTDDSKDWIWNNWNTFFADLEDSNDGFVWDMKDPKKLKGKLIGGKFHIEQSEYNGKVYNHTRLRWTCVAEQVRNDTFGQLPMDKLIAPSAPASDPDDFMTLPDGVEDELPF